MTQAPGGYPSRLAGMTTKPSARVVLDRMDAPLIAKGLHPSLLDSDPGVIDAADD